MLTKEDIISGVIRVEGGYVNNQNDLGGETNYGITKPVAIRHQKGLCGNFGWDCDMHNLSKEMAFYIYEKDYWKSIRLDDIHSIMPLVAEKLFDIGVNIGVTRAGKWLQEIINALGNNKFPDLVVDGKIGQKTIDALNAVVNARNKEAVEGAILKSLFCLQGAHYINISNTRSLNRTFTFGWLNRLNHRLDDYYTAFKRT